jgi:hypothetical protein
MVGSPVFSEPVDVDAAKWFNEAAEPKVGRLSGSMYQALRAVENYRKTKQKDVLRSSELVLENFVISVRNDQSDPWLRKHERSTCFTVAFEAKYADGEEVALDRTATSLGRTALYAVRKKDYAIERTEFPKPPDVK